jgi:hypothetical protein
MEMLRLERGAWMDLLLTLPARVVILTLALGRELLQGPVVQRLAYPPVTRVVAGSNPVRSARIPTVSRWGTFGKVAQLVEHATENRSVAGSIPALATSSEKARS